MAHSIIFQYVLFLLFPVDLSGDRLSSVSVPFNISHITCTSLYSQVLTSFRSFSRPVFRIPKRLATPFQTVRMGNIILSHHSIANLLPQLLVMFRPPPLQPEERDQKKKMTLATLFSLSLSTSPLELLLFPCLSLPLIKFLIFPLH